MLRPKWGIGHLFDLGAKLLKVAQNAKKPALLW
jgi:hypothetical protein